MTYFLTIEPGLTVDVEFSFTGRGRGLLRQHDVEIERVTDGDADRPDIAERIKSEPALMLQLETAAMNAEDDENEARREDWSDDR